MDDIEYNRQMEYDMMMNELLSMGEDIDEYQKEMNYDLIGDVFPDTDIDVKKLIIINEDANNNKISKSEVVKFPISTDEKYMKNKKYNYNTYATVTLFSKHTKGENHRYIMEDDMEKNKYKMEDCSKVKFETLKENIKKLSRLEGNLVTDKIINGKLTYIINYENEDKRKYVTVEEEILKNLVNDLKSSSIKVYMLLKYKCNTKKFTRIIKESINESIGLNSNSGKNKKGINKTLDLLRDMDLIEKYIRTEKLKNKDGKIVYTPVTYVRLVSYEEYVKIRKEKEENEKRN